MLIEEPGVQSTPEPSFQVRLRQQSALLFQLDAQFQVLEAESAEVLYAADLSADRSVSWTPRGEYRLLCRPRDLRLAAGSYRYRWLIFAEVGRERVLLAERVEAFDLGEGLDPVAGARPEWVFESEPCSPAIDDLAWARGYEDWFFRHFDHAALVVTDYLLKQHPLLRGRILDVGCGDGIIDLGIFLRMQPEELVGIDPFRGFDRLPGVLADNHLPGDLLDDPRLRFLPEDANDLPFEDDHFDVVVSWGSLEHIAGGYGRALDEIRRVLKPDGLLFVHPGLFYGALGNHLGEFFDDPWIHLKQPPEDLREAVLNTEPRRMDRAGHVATPAEYWQWYTELNRITVADFERELRRRGFQPWRAAVRSSDVVEYSPELQGHSILDLATAELYLSAWNRK